MYKRLNNIAFYAMFFILLVLFSSVFFFVQNDNKEKLVSVSDRIVKNFREGLDYEMVDLLSFSLALAEDGALKNALISEDEEEGYAILSHISERFKKYTHLKSLHIQVLTPEFFIFARSWGQGFEGMPIWWFRDDLETLSKNSEPKVGMETGRLLTFKATVPIRSGYKILGYLEVIKFIDTFASKLRKKGIELVALMDEKYLKQASLMRDFPVVHNYVISNQNFNRQLLPAIEMLDWDDFSSKGYIYKNGMLYLNEPMYNGKGKQIGIYMLVVSEDALKKFENENEHISFFSQFSDEDIQKVVKAWSEPYGSFKNKHDRDLIELLPKLRKEDKVQLEFKARSALRTYTKEELIDIILDTKHKEKKVGEIQ